MLDIGVDDGQRRLAEVGPEDVVVANYADRAGHVHIASPQTLQHSYRQKGCRTRPGRSRAARSHIGSSGALVQRRHERAETDDLDAESRGVLRRLAAAKYEKACGFLVSDGAAASAKIAEGRTFVTIGADSALLATAATAQLARARDHNS